MTNRMFNQVTGEAFLFGHTWFCKACQDALTAVNVRTFHVARPSISDRQQPEE